MSSNAARRHTDGDTRATDAPSMKRWDGHNRTAVEWSGLHREPKLWLADGNCLIYLYAKGQSDKSASFRVDFAALVKARCYTFITRYIDKQGRNFDMPTADADWRRLCPKRTVSLYVAPASDGSRADMARHHVGIRNFLAWAIGLPLVGTHLGCEIVSLFRNMVNYRPANANCVKDILSYLEFAGYLDIVALPHHALAVLYVSEFLRQTDLYTRAFVHCVGMGERIYGSIEYTKLSLVSRKLIRTARQKLENKLSNAIDDVSSFLDEELSESRLGLPHALRAHLDRFRSALFTFYTARFGYFPPRDFDAKVVQTMLEDFEALYDLLVDDGAETPGMMGGNNGGGLCILQIIRTFDRWNSFETRRHPLPLLPAVPEARRTRRMPWLGRGEREKPTSQLLAHTALIKASNWREVSFKNELVRMYREFEGETLQPPTNKADKPEKISPTDARKVRWILIYAMCQMLRSISKRSPQVEAEKAPYFLTASTVDLPPWTAALKTTTSANSALPTMPASADKLWQPKLGDGLEIKPDIDYFALTHNVERQQQPEKLNRRRSLPAPAASCPTTPSPSKSLRRSNSLLRRSTIRNSIRNKLRPGTATTETPTPTPTAESPPAKSAYHEIVVHGYGNGTNKVKLERRNTISCDNSQDSDPSSPSRLHPVDTRLPDIAPPTTEPSVPPTAQSRSSSNRSGSNRSSNASTIATLESQGVSGSGSPSTIAPPEFEQYDTVEPVIVRNSSHKSLTQRYPMRAVLGTLGRTSSKQRRGSMVSNPNIMVGKEQQQQSQAAQQQDALMMSGGGGQSQGPSLRKSLLPESWMLTGRTTCESDIDEEDEILTMESEADEWVAMQAFLDDDVSGSQMARGWEQYNDLGGLIEVG